MIKKRLFLGILFLVLYGLSAAHLHVNYADSDDITLASRFGGLAHPPGYVWFTLVLGVFMRLLPWVSPALVANGSVVMVSAINVVLFSLLLYRGLRLIKISHQTAASSSLLAAAWWGVSSLVWRHATVVEVFPVAQLLILLCWSAFLGKQRLWTILWGVASVLFHPLSIIVVVLPLIQALWIERWRGALMGLFVVLMEVVCLVVVAQGMGVYGWPLTINALGLVRFWWRSDLLAVGGSAVESLVTHFSLAGWLWTLQAWVRTIWYEWGAIPFVLMGIGMGWWWKRGVRAVAIMALAAGPVLALYMAFPQPGLVSEVGYYWGTALRLRMFFAWQLVAGVLVAGGLAAWLTRFSVHKRWIMAAVFVLVLWTGVRWRAMDASHDNVVPLLTKSVLQALPERAVLVVDSDMVFGFLYEQLVYSVRPDVAVVPSGIVVMPAWWREQKGALYGIEFDDPVKQAAEVVGWSIHAGKRVFLYAADSRLLASLEQEGRQYFVTPYGYTLEVSRQRGEILKSYDYGLSKQLGEQATSETDWWLRGLQAHLAIIHAQAAYYYARMGAMETARIHADLGIKLSLFEQSRQAIAQSLVVGEREFRGQQ